MTTKQIKYKTNHLKCEINQRTESIQIKLNIHNDYESRSHLPCKVQSNVSNCGKAVVCKQNLYTLTPVGRRERERVVLDPRPFDTPLILA